MMNEENKMKDLAKLVEQGYKWIARDNLLDRLWVYKEQPLRNGILFQTRISDFNPALLFNNDNKLDFITFNNSPFKIQKIAYDMLEFDNNTSLSKIVNVYGGQFNIANFKTISGVRNNDKDVDEFDVIKSMTNTIRDSFNFAMNGMAFASGNIEHNYVDEFNLLPKKIVYNAKLGRTTLIYNNNYVVRSEATQGDLKTSTLELGIYIALLKSLELERLDHIINYTWTNFKTSKQKEIYLSGILHTELQGYGVSRNQLDKIVKSLKDNKDKVIINVDNKDYHIELEYKGE